MNPSWGAGYPLPELIKQPALTIKFDGSIRPNPGGIMTYGFIILGPNGLLRNGYGYSGSGPEATNNVSEYAARIASLTFLRDVKWTGKLLVLGDSEIVVKQVNAMYECIAEHLVPYRNKCRLLFEAICPTNDFELKWIPLEQNTVADSLSKRAYDKYVAALNPQ